MRSLSIILFIVFCAQTSHVKCDGDEGDEMRRWSLFYWLDPDILAPYDEVSTGITSKDVGDAYEPYLDSDFNQSEDETDDSDSESASAITNLDGTDVEKESELNDNEESLELIEPNLPEVQDASNDESDDDDLSSDSSTTDTEAAIKVDDVQATEAETGAETEAETETETAVEALQAPDFFGLSDVPEVSAPDNSESDDELDLSDVAINSELMQRLMAILSEIELDAEEAENPQEGEAEIVPKDDSKSDSSNNSSENNEDASSPSDSNNSGDVDDTYAVNPYVKFDDLFGDKSEYSLPHYESPELDHSTVDVSSDESSTTIQPTDDKPYDSSESSLPNLESDSVPLDDKSSDLTPIDTGSVNLYPTDSDVSTQSEIENNNLDENNVADVAVEMNEPSVVDEMTQVNDIEIEGRDTLHVVEKPKEKTISRFTIASLLKGLARRFRSD